jgi:hypothetical protein
MKRSKFNWLGCFYWQSLHSLMRDDEEKAPTIPVEDGIYVFGGGTALTTYDIKGLMRATKNEVDQSDRPAFMSFILL